jgi:hypothetical protein
MILDFFNNFLNIISYFRFNDVAIFMFKLVLTSY